MEKELKKLVPGETVIKELKGTVQGKYGVFHVYYGNYVYPNYNGMDRIRDSKTYRDMVEDFLNSDEGKEYECPTEEEFIKAEEEVKNRIHEYRERLEKEEESSEKTEQTVQEVVEEKTQEPSQDKTKAKEKMKFVDDEQSENYQLSLENEKLLKEKEKLEKQLEKANRKEIKKSRPRTEKINDMLISILSVALIIFSLTVAVFMYMYSFMR